jgi:lysozyme
VIDDLVADLKREEGWRPDLYKDHLGFWTIGYGFLVDPEKGGGLPLEIGEYWLRYEVDRRVAALSARWTAFDEQPPPVQRALGQMAYQLGVNGTLAFRKMLAALEQGDRITAAREALDSNWARQTPERARRVAQLIRGRT